MTTELRITLPGPEGSGDARRALVVLERLVTLLGQLEDVALNRGTMRPDERSTWGITNIRLGSLQTTIAPSRPQHGATSDLLAQVAEWTVDGFAEAEDHEGLPPRWDRTAGSTAVELANLLGLMPDLGMQLELLANGRPVRQVTVTRRSAEHLSPGVNIRRKSIGSVVGRLDSATVHERREAGLWPTAGGGRVAVLFRETDVDVIRAALGCRVEVSGTLTRDANDRLISIRLRELEVLPNEGPPLTGLTGMDPGFTSGLTPAEHLREIRGAS